MQDLNRCLSKDLENEKMINIINYYCSVAKSCLNSVTPCLQHTRLQYPSVSFTVCSNSSPFSWWCYVTILCSAAPSSFSLHSLPASGSFLMSQLFAPSGQSIGATALAWVLPVNIQGWFHLGLIVLIFLLSKGLSRIFSSTTILKQQFLAISLFYGPTLTSVHDYMINHSFDYMDLLFSVLSSFVIAFLPISKCLLISWLH